jgi:hypothetical protein
MALPEYKWIGWAIIALGIAVFVFQVRVENGGFTAHWPRRETMWPVIGMAVSALAFAVFGIWYLQTRTINAPDAATKQETATPLSIAETIRAESFRLKTKPEIWINVYYVIVGNDDPKRTLQNVSADLHTFERPSRCPIRGSGFFASNIRNGEYIYFRLGHIASLKPLGLPVGDESSGSVTVTDEMKKNYLHNLPLGFFSFEPSERQALFNLGANAHFDPYQFKLVVTGNDISAATAEVRIEMLNAKPSITLTAAHSSGWNLTLGARA